MDSPLLWLGTLTCAAFVCGNGKTRGVKTERPSVTTSGPLKKLFSFFWILPTSALSESFGVRVAMELSQSTRFSSASRRMT